MERLVRRDFKTDDDLTVSGRGYSASYPLLNSYFGLIKSDMSHRFALSLVDAHEFNDEHAFKISK